jgi:hypothetical protein
VDTWTLTIHNIDHGGQRSSPPPGNQECWEAALTLAVATYGNREDPNRLIVVLEAFLWERLGRIDAFADATATTPYRAFGVNDLDIVAFAGRGIQVGEVKPNPRYLRAPALLLPIRLGDGPDVTVVATHLSPWSAQERCEQVLPLNSLLRREHVVVAGDINCVGPKDPEPDIDQMPVWQRPCHTRVVDGRRAWDRRPTELAREAGWIDLATEFGQAAQPTGGYGQSFPPVRFDQIWADTTMAGAATDYRVHRTPEFEAISDHLPVSVIFGRG